MSSIVDPQPEMPAAEELVAYLDGELPPDDCRRVEQRLAADAEYRRQLRDLDQAWEALDALPSPKTNDDFARTTMELVTVAAQEDVSLITANVAADRRRRMLWWASAGMAGATLGFLAAWVLLPDRNQALLRDLPVIRQADVLRQIESVEFLRQLSDGVPLERLMTDEAAIDEEMSELALAGAASLGTRRKWVESLSTEEKAKLAAQAKRFVKLARIPGEQDRLLALQREISDAKDADLQRTLVAYGAWLSGLTAANQEQLRDELQDLPPDEQVKRVQQLVRQQSQQVWRRLPPDDAEKLRKELLSIAQERQQALLKEFRGRGDRDRLRGLEGPRGALMILIKELQNEDAGDQIRERLLNQLSPEARAHFENLGGGRRRWQLWLWIRDSLKPTWGPDELERFFAEELNHDERERLLSLPPAEMQTQLERLYFGAALGIRDPERWWNDFRESGGPQDSGGSGRPEFRPDGRPRDRGRAGGPREDFFERDRMQPGPDGPLRQRDDRFPEGRRPRNRSGPPPDRASLPP